MLDFVLSDEGQAIWAKAYLRPVRASAMPKEVQAQFLPAAEYARAKTVDYGAMAAAQRGFSDRYLREVRWTPRQRLLLAGCAAPAGAFFLAFWLLPALADCWRCRPNRAGRPISSC